MALRTEEEIRSRYSKDHHFRNGHQSPFREEPYTLADLHNTSVPRYRQVLHGAYVEAANSGDPKHLPELKSVLNDVFGNSPHRSVPTWKNRMAIMVAETHFGMIEYGGIEAYLDSRRPAPLTDTRDREQLGAWTYYRETERAAQSIEARILTPQREPALSLNGAYKRVNSTTPSPTPTRR